MISFKIDDKTFQVEHGVPSARRRIAFTRILADSDKTTDGVKQKIQRLVLEASVTGKDQKQAWQEALEAGEFTADDILALNEISVEETEENCKTVFRLFRECADLSQLPTGVKEKINDDDFMMDQNFLEVRDFVDTFRKKFEQSE